MASSFQRSSGSDTASWLLIAAMLLVFLLLQQADPFGIRAGTALLPMGSVALLSAAALACRMRAMPRASAAAIGFLQMTLFTLLGILLSYAVAAHAGDLWDDRLAAVDRSVGLDWPAVARRLDGSAPMALLTGVAYHSLIPQMIVAIVALSAVGEFRILRITICAAILSGFATILLSGIFPAQGNLFDPGEYRQLWPSIAWLHSDVIAGLRDGSFRELDLGALMGIVTFPSYHAALAAIFIWSFRHVPGLRIAGGLWALLTIVATPIGGGHYLADVLAGILLAAISIPVAHRLVRIAPVAPLALGRGEALNLVRP